MKDERILFALGDVDEKYLAAAKPIGKKRIPFARAAVVAAGVLLAVAVVLTFALLGGGDNVVESGNNTPGIDNQKFLASMRDYLLNSDATLSGGVGDSGSGDIPESTTPNGNYMEITDNQVAGIIEGDLAKATDKYLFRLGTHTIYIYSLDGAQSNLVSTFTLPYIIGEQSAQRYYDMFLSEDGNTITLFCEYSGGTLGKTAIISVDVSDVANPREKNVVTINGNKEAVRKIGDSFYVVTNWYFSRTRIDLDDPASFIPSIDYADGKHVCDSNKIIVPDKISRVYYRYLTVLNESDLSLDDEMALMVYGSVYFTENNIIFDSPTSKTETEGDKTYSVSYSKIGILSFADELAWRGFINVKGRSSGQYSFDERDGALRMVLSVESFSVFDNASLYIYDIKTLEQIASVERFAPEGEIATAVRFEGDRLYVCTAEVIKYTDPIYFFDLSDYTNITYVDTGFIDGFSSSLIDLGEGYLLGIGREDGSTNKIEVYKKEGDSVVSVDKYLFGGTVNTDYKSFLIDRERNLFGVSVSNYTKDGSPLRSIFLIVRIDDGRISLVSASGSSNSYARAFAYNGSVYLTIPNYFYVIDENGSCTVELFATHSIKDKTPVADSAVCGEYPMIENTCECGRVTVTSDYSSKYVAHELTDGICSLCGADVGSKEKNAPLIIYTSLGDGICYVSGTKETIFGVVEIPKYSPKGDLVIAIGKSSFGNSGISRIILPDSITVIDDVAFYNCVYLTEVSMSDGLKRIGDLAFGYCERLESAVIPDTVEKIGEQAFNSCQALTTVKLPEGLTVIPRGAFNLCYKLLQADIPDSVVTIGDFAFNMCRSLKIISIPDSVETVGARAFQYCSAAIQVVVGKRVESIGEYAFNECVSIVEIVNRSDLAITAGSADHGGIGLYARSVVKDNSRIVTVGDYLFLRSDEVNILISYLGNDSKITLPTLSDGETYEIGTRAFEGNTSITSVTIPDCVTAIGNNAFSGCTGIAYLKLPDSVKVIGDRAFSNCYFTSFNMGNGVVVIGTASFNGCSRLESIRMSTSLEVIGESAFNGCYKLEDVKIPSSVREIKPRAFQACFAIKQIAIPDGVRVIEEDVFNNCKGLVYIVIPTSVVEIKDNFYACYALKAIHYKGSQEEWKAISFSYTTGTISKVKIEYNYKY